MLHSQPPTFSPLTSGRQETLLLLSGCEGPGSRPPSRVTPPIGWGRAVWVLPAAFANECGAWAASVVLGSQVAPHLTFSVLLARHFLTRLVRLFWAFCFFGVLMLVLLRGRLLHLFGCVNPEANLGSGCILLLQHLRL